MNDAWQLLIALSFALPSFAMSARLFHVWRAPLEIEDGRWVQLGVGVFVAEFILLHAGTFIGANAGGGGAGPKLYVILVLFYGLFIAAISAAFRSAMFLRSFLALVIGRGIAVVLGTSRQDADLLLAHSAVGVALYMLMVFASVLVRIPRRGITEEIAKRFRVAGSSGSWAEEPHRAIGAGAIYFGLLGIAELTLLSWMDPRVITQR